MTQPPVDSLVRSMRAVLVDRGPLGYDDLAAAVAEAGDGASGGHDAVAEVLDRGDELFVALADDRWAWLPALLDGRVFTHRVGVVEATHDVIYSVNDLFPLWVLADDERYRQLSDGAPLSEAIVGFDDELLAERGVPAEDVDGDSVLLLPAGRLAALQVVAGDLIALRVRGDGLELCKVTAPQPSEAGAAVSRLVATYPETPMTLDRAVWTVCADSGLFTEPTLPLSELIADAGLAQQAQWIASPGFDFVGWRLAQRIESIRHNYALTSDGALAVLATVFLYQRVVDLVETITAAADDDAAADLAEIVSRPVAAAAVSHMLPGEPVGAEPATVRAALRLLADPAVAEAALAEMEATDHEAAAALGVFAETAEPLAPRAARPALRWLRAIARERLGEIEQAEQVLLAAESLDPSWPPTLVSLARYAADRSDAERALALLRRAGAPPDDETVQMLEHFRPMPRSDIGRNERCWCGSGRKYKVCHLNHEQLSLEERAAWLYQKAGATLTEDPAVTLLVSTAQARSRHWHSPDPLADALHDPLVGDAVLFEGGVFADFLTERGGLLPDDERLLAQQWLLVQRSVYEVLDVVRGQGFTVRDVRTGDVHQVRERAASTQVTVGAFYCARVVPAGESMQIFGGMEPVSLGERDQLIALLDDDPGPVELVEFLSRRFAPPILRNTEGESLVFCEATLRVDDPAALTDKLDARYDRIDDPDDDGLHWLEQVVTHGIERIRAELRLRGDQLQVSANSETRFERVLAAVGELDPSAVVLTENREPIDMAALAGRRGEPAPSVVPVAELDPAQHPELAAALDDMARTYEKAWLDEQIPALAGHTPRECANDPTRRQDLIRLLNSFPPDNDRPGTMSVDRLRAMLGL